MESLKRGILVTLAAFSISAVMAFGVGGMILLSLNVFLPNL